MSERGISAAVEKILPCVEKPGRYTGGEWNEIRKDPARVRAKIALAFPDVYEIGMSYLGQKILYALINARPDYLAERVFAPWPDFEAALRKAGLPLPSLENKIPLAEFDILGFSLLYELNYTNILSILDLARIPLRSSERDERHPLVIAGGPSAFNPEPVAEFFDLFLVGDGEEAFLEIIEAATSLKERGFTRDALVGELALISGVYVPSLYEAHQSGPSRLLAVRPKPGAPRLVRKRMLRSFPTSPFPEDIIVPNLQTVFDRVAVEVGRGCPQKCRFCQATSLYMPFRVKDPSAVIEKVVRSLRSTGYEDASLFSLSVSDYPYLGETVGTLMETLERDHVSLSLSSLRPKGLSPDIVRAILKVRKTGFTLVPEAGSERLRRVINKDLQDQDIRDAAANAFREGWRLIKVYFMIGLPTETEEDLAAIVGLIEDLTALGRGILGSPPRINMSVSSFVPKPHTPFQWAAMDDDRTLRDKQLFLRHRLKTLRHVQMKDHPVENSRLEAVFSRGDRRLGRVLRIAWSSGARFDSWNDFFQAPLWAAAFAEAGVDMADYLGTMDRDAVLPWDHIHTGVRKKFLNEEFSRALEGRSSPSCLETTCGQCGGCDYPADLRRDHAARIEVAPAPRPVLGRMTDGVIRYQAFYAKQGPARFFGHNDLLNVLQRSFKRAGVEVLYSEGFHPKMLMSFVPALPLGMVGLRESFEFKTAHVFDPMEFVAALNRSVPPGISFSDLIRIESANPPLAARIESFDYLLPLDAEVLRLALEEKKGETLTKDAAADYAEALMDAFRPEKSDLLSDIRLDRGRSRIVFTIMYTPQKSLRPQDVVERVFGLPKAVYVLIRESIRFR